MTVCNEEKIEHPNNRPCHTSTAGLYSTSTSLSVYYEVKMDFSI